MHKSTIGVLWLVVAVTCTEAQDSGLSFRSMAPIDAHVHVFNTSARFDEMLRRLNLRVVNICVVDKYERGYEDAATQHTRALEVFRATHGRAAWCSTFDPQDWETPDFAERVIKELDVTFQEGAEAVKIYKSIGMELKSRTGKYLMPDDPVFDPIFDHLENLNKTLYTHLAAVSAAWRPLDLANRHYGYLKANPDWHMYLHPSRPAKETIIAARDRILAHHPKLRMVGCHLGSMEEDVDEIAQRFERYPNFVVDTAGRVSDLMLQPREKVRAFLIKYQDRVLYGTDLAFMPWGNPYEMGKGWESTYERDWKWFATNETFVYREKTIRGLALPELVLRKIYHENTIKWVPGAL